MVFPRAFHIVVGLRLALGLVVVAGCAQWDTPGRSPLVPVKMFDDSVALEITFVRFPWGQVDLGDDLWREIDEQQIDRSTRLRLDAQGFRVGVLSGYLPDALARQLATTALGSPGELETITELDHESAVSSRHVQTRRGKRIDVVASSNYARLPVLEYSGDGALQGRDYRQAECHFALRALPQADGTVEIELLPEVHHGELRPRLTPRPEMGMVMFETSRQRQTFDPLRVVTSLAPGEILVLGTRTDQSGSLAAGFFGVSTDGEGPREQKLLLVRLAQTQHDGVFSTEELLENSPEAGSAAEGTSHQENSDSQAEHTATDSLADPTDLPDPSTRDPEFGATATPAAEQAGLLP